MNERYEVAWSKPAKRAVGKDLPEAVAAAVVELVTGALADNPHRLGKPLEKPFEGLWSARRATYRVFYRIDEQHQRIIVETVRHRGQAYRS